MTYESGPEKRARLLREYVERRRQVDPGGWERRMKVGAQVQREIEDRYRVVYGSADSGLWPRVPRDPGPSLGHAVPAHGGILGQDVFATERRVVRRTI